MTEEQIKLIEIAKKRKDIDIDIANRVFIAYLASMNLNDDELGKLYRNGLISTQERTKLHANNSN